MNERSVKVLARGSWFLVIACSVVAIALMVLAWNVPTLPNEFGPKGFAIVFAFALGGVGAVIAARRPSNPIGWIFCILGVVSGVMAVSTEYARWAVIDERGRPPGGLYAAWLQEWLWIPLIAGLAVVAALFPDGRFLSRRWRLAVVSTGLLVAVPTILSAIVPRLTIYRGFPNPVGLGDDGLIDLAGASVALILPVILLGTASAVARFRRARGEERQQLKWLVLAMTVVALMIKFYGIVTLAAGGSANPQDIEWSEYLMVAGFVAVPVSIAFGVLKYRLYDIDVVINKALVYGALAVFITLVYVAIVVGVGAAIGSRGNAVLSAIAAAIVALAFQPVRRRAQHVANRLVYGKRATPYEVLSELATRFAGTYSLEDALPRLARIVAESAGAQRVDIWLRVDQRLLNETSFPATEPRAPIDVTGDELPRFPEGELAVDVRHHGELLGAISARLPAGQTPSPAESKLVADVAAQAGLVLRNVGLLEELRASRRRIVAAQDDRAKALERNIHDGAQQQLVALSVKLRLADQLLEADPARARELLLQLHTDTSDALENLRDLARGIYPPLPADKGLAAALEAQARKSPIPVAVEPNGVGRFPEDVESAVYFCALEALQNVAKYAEASAVAVRLAERNGRLEFDIEDDGVGFDTANTARGSGLQNMADRLEALAGGLEIESMPGGGTTVRGWVPRRQREGAR